MTLFSYLVSDFADKIKQRLFLLYMQDYIERSSIYIFFKKYTDSIMNVVFPLIRSNQADWG